MDSLLEGRIRTLGPRQQDLGKHRDHRRSRAPGAQIGGKKTNRSAALGPSQRVCARLISDPICPISGKSVATTPSISEGAGMSEPTELSDLVAYLVRTSRLTRSDAVRLVDEVLSFLAERPEEFVCRRHRALQAEGLSNSEIFSRLQAELSRWRFRAPVYTERQIRRLIYG